MSVPNLLLTLIGLHLLLVALLTGAMLRRAARQKSERARNDALQLSMRQAWQAQQTAQEARQDERRQLVRDLHDGFGSKLASLRLLAQKGRISPTQMADHLKEIMADLHLFADTLCHDEITLAHALADMRYRTESRHAEGSPRLHWQVRLEDMPAQEARTALHILRVMQEAMHNAMRHAQARNIWLSAEYDSAPDRLTVSVRDDGVGLPDGLRRGQGINNMQQRAREIGARLLWMPLQPGTEVLLTYDRLRERATAAPAAAQAPGAAAVLPLPG